MLDQADAVITLLIIGALLVLLSIVVRVPRLNTLLWVCGGIALLIALVLHLDATGT